MKRLITFLLLLPLFANAITPVYLCGFECGVTNINLHWASITGTASFQTGTVRNGARAGRCNPSAATGYFETPNNLAGSSIWVVRFYIRFATLPNANCAVLQIANSVKCGVYFKQSDSKLYPGTDNGSVNFGATGATVTTGVWYRVDVRVNLTNNPNTVDLQVDGSAQTQHTLAVAPGFTFASRLGDIGVTGNTTNTADFYVDDVILSNTSGDYPIGGGYVNHFVPTSDGTHNIAGSNDFERSATGTDILNATTTAWQLIDDVPLKSGVAAEYINLTAPPNATDYVELIFGPASGISTPTTAPRIVSAIFAYANATSGTNNLRIAINDNGTTNDVFNGNAATTGTTIIYIAKSYSDPPSSASVWTLSGNGNFNNVRMRCYTNDAAPDPWLASAMIEAEFQEQVTLPPHRIKIISKNKSKEKDIYTNASHVSRLTGHDIQYTSGK